MTDAAPDLLHVLEEVPLEQAPTVVLRVLRDVALEGGRADAGRLHLRAHGHQYDVDRDGIRVQEVVGPLDLPPAREDRWVVPIRLHGRCTGYFELPVHDSRRSEDRRDRLRRLGAVAALLLDDASTQVAGEWRRQWIHAAYDIADILTPPMGTLAAIEQIARIVRRLTRASHTLVVTNAGGRVDVLTEDGLGSGTSAVLADPRTWLSPSTSLSERRADDGATVLAIGLNTHLVEPMRLLILFAPGVPVPTEAELVELGSFVEFTSLLVDRSEAVANEAAHTMARERTRIATSLHDGAIQGLFAAGLELQALKNATDRDQLGRSIDHVVGLVDGTIVELRRTIAALGGIDPPPTSIPSGSRAVTR